MLRRVPGFIPTPADWVGALAVSGVGRRVVGWRAMARERDHGTDRRASPCRATGSAVPGGTGCDRGAALPGDPAAGAGTGLSRSGGSGPFSAALGGGAGGALQRVRSRSARRSAAAEWPCRHPADRRGAVRLGRAGAGAARGGRGVERPQGGRLDRSPSRPGAGASAARLGSPEADRLVHPGAATTACAGGGPRAAGRLRKGLEEAVAQAKAAHPDRPVEVWAADEHRLGLKPVRRRVWAPVGQRPIALGHHRYQWLHVVAFVQPTSGETVWYLATGLSKPWDRVVSRDRPVETLLRGPARRLRPADRRRPKAPHRPGARQCRLAWPRRPRRPRREQPGVPAALHSGIAAGRASLAAGRRGGGQHAFRRTGRAPCHRRSTLPPASCRRYHTTHRLPLVAPARQAALISRSWYDTDTETRCS